MDGTVECRGKGMATKSVPSRRRNHRNRVLCERAHLNMAASIVPGLPRSVSTDTVYGMPPTLSSTWLAEPRA